MDILIEAFIEIYMELMLLVVPEKNVTKKHRVIAFIMAIAELILLAALVIWGVSLLVEQGSMFGLIPLAIVLAISILQIVLGIKLYKTHH